MHLFRTTGFDLRFRCVFSLPILQVELGAT